MASMAEDIKKEHERNQKRMFKKVLTPLFMNSNFSSLKENTSFMYMVPPFFSWNMECRATLGEFLQLFFFSLCARFQCHDWLHFRKWRIYSLSNHFGKFNMESYKVSFKGVEGVLSVGENGVVWKYANESENGIVPYSTIVSTKKTKPSSTKAMVALIGENDIMLLSAEFLSNNPSTSQEEKNANAQSNLNRFYETLLSSLKRPGSRAQSSMSRLSPITRLTNSPGVKQANVFYYYSFYIWFPFFLRVIGSDQNDCIEIHPFFFSPSPFRRKLMLSRERKL